MTAARKNANFTPVELIKRLHHAEIIIPRGKEDEARAFYCELLGLQEISKPVQLRANGGIWLQLGENQVHLSIQDGYDPRTTKAHLAYEVTDLALLGAKLKARGFELIPNESIPGYIRGNIRDPFGNRIEFLQRDSQF